MGGGGRGCAFCNYPIKEFVAFLKKKKFGLESLIRLKAIKREEDL
jgi:hypothetical protein